MLLTIRTTTPGIGNKIVFQFKWQQTKAEELPSPNRYEVRTDPGKGKLKYSFGLPHEVYSKTYLPYNKHQSPEVARFLPGMICSTIVGPGEYQVRKELG
jgi:hypothetical protein